MSKSTTIVTAAEVRAFVNADAKRLAALSPEAQVTVAKGARGRLHPEVVALHNQRRRTRQYVTGATKEATAKAEAAAKALREAAVQAGQPVGKRGPLSKAALDALKG